MGPSARLHIGSRKVRAASTQFELHWEDSDGGTCTAYYKVLTPPRDCPAWWPEAIRSSLRRAALLDERLADLGRDEPVQAARVLAIDPAKFVIVTLAIPGAPLSQHLRSFWRRGRGRLTPAKGRWKAHRSRGAVRGHCSNERIRAHIDCSWLSRRSHARLLTVPCVRRFACSADLVAEQLGPYPHAARRTDRGKLQVFAAAALSEWVSLNPRMLDRE